MNIGIERLEDLIAELREAHNQSTDPEERAALFDEINELEEKLDAMYRMSPWAISFENGSSNI